MLLSDGWNSPSVFSIPKYTIIDTVSGAFKKLKIYIANTKLKC